MGKQIERRAVVPATLALAFTIALMAASASKAQNPTAEAAATITFHNVASGFILPNSTFYTTFDNDACKPASGDVRLPAAHFMLNKSQKTLPLPAGRKVYVRGVLSMTVWNGGGRELKNCAIMTAFTPQPNRQYDMHLGLDAGQCVATVLDQQSGTPPQDVQALPLRWVCK